jgi:phage tail-like protein
MGLLQQTKTISKPPAVTLTVLSDIEELPVPIYNYSILVDSVAVALFQKISGMSVKRETESFSEGGLNNFGRELPGHISYGHVTFETGLTSNSFFWDWMMAGQYGGFAKSLDFTVVQRRPVSPAPKTGKPVFEVIKTWDFANAFPVSWKVSDLDVGEQKKIAVETLEISFDFFQLHK